MNYHKNSKTDDSKVHISELMSSNATSCTSRAEDLIMNKDLGILGKLLETVHEQREKRSLDEGIKNYFYAPSCFNIVALVKNGENCSTCPYSLYSNRGRTFNSSMTYCGNPDVIRRTRDFYSDLVEK